jgi:mevalonate kinase
MGGQRGVEIKISSTIPVASGLGSGAAVSVALTRALSTHLNHQMTDEEVNAFVFEIEKIHHGTPSGIDNTVVTYVKPVYFEKGKPIEILKVGHPFTIVIADTGIPAPTKASVSDVRHLWLNNKSYWETVFDKVGHVSFMARRAIEAGKHTLSNIQEWKILGELMNENHELLQEMKVSSPELDKLVSAAISAGALGAKLSGGGRGGNMIALVETEKAETITRSLEAAGAQHTIITQVV